MAVSNKGNSPLNDKLGLHRLTQSRQLQALFKSASKLSGLEEKLEKALPPILKGKLHVIGVEGSTLQLVSPSAALSTRLRLVEKQLLQQLKQDNRFYSITRIVVKVRPVAPPGQAVRFKRRLSKENAQLLKEVAGHTKDTKLKQVLIRLSERASS